MVLVNVHGAKTRLSRLLHRVEAGEEIVIGRGGRPAARLVPYREPPRRRCGGQWRGRVTMAADFDELPQSILAAFHGATEEG